MLQLYCMFSYNTHSLTYKISHFGAVRIVQDIIQVSSHQRFQLAKTGQLFPLSLSSISHSLAYSLSLPHSGVNQTYVNTSYPSVDSIKFGDPRCIGDSIPTTILNKEDDSHKFGVNSTNFSNFPTQLKF